MKIVLSSSLVLAALVATPTKAAFPADVRALMDTSVDPCDDFYQYSCGGWIKNFTLPADTVHYVYGRSMIKARNQVVIQQIIKEKKPLVGEFYDSCIKLSTLSALGNAPLRKTFANITAASTKKEFSTVAGELGTIGPSLFTGLSVDPDPHDATINVLGVGPASLVLPDPGYYAPDQFPSIEAPFRKYISTIVTLAGINVTDAHGKNESTKYAEDVVINIDKKFAEILPTDEETDGYFWVKYSEALTKWPLTFAAMVQGLDLLKQSALTLDSKVMLESSAFMDRAEKLFNSLELNDMKLYYAFRYVDAYVEYLGTAFVQASFDFYDAALDGDTVPTPREKLCTSSLISLLPDLIGQYYYDKMFDAAREQQVEAMVNAIEQAMGQDIAQLSWLDDATRKAAAAKLAKVANLIGHSTDKKEYPYVLTKDNYFTNVQTIQTQGYKETLASIDKPVDRNAWEMSAATVNAYYSPQQNQMVFPAAILQPPFYNGSSHPVQNFGGIGAVIGHELTHGFDTTGRHYDGYGNQVEWWSSTMTKAFNDRATCMENQYSQYVAYGDSGKPVGHVDGNLTIGENIADNGGLGLAFAAYHNWVKSAGKLNTNGVEDSEVDKLFFLSFGQLWCEKITDNEQKDLLEGDIHSPGPVRTNGVLKNNEQFAKTFQCKVGSKMNPEKKCKIW